MRRFWSLSLPLLLTAGLTVAGCTIEPTPRRYIDQQETPAEEIARTGRELQDRLRSVGSALQRGSGAEISAALMPHPDVHFFGARPGEESTTTEGVARALQVLRPGGGVRTQDVMVTVAPRNNVAWFRAVYTGLDEDDSAALIRLSGVFLRYEGQWRLVQGHLSRQINQSPPPQEVVADTVVGGV